MQLTVVPAVDRDIVNLARILLLCAIATYSTTISFSALDWSIGPRNHIHRLGQLPGIFVTGVKAEKGFFHCTPSASK